jgi:hypothetical protein
MRDREKDYPELQIEALEARIGAEMAMGLPCIPNPVRGDKAPSRR